MSNEITMVLMLCGIISFFGGVMVGTQSQSEITNEYKKLCQELRERLKETEKGSQ